MQDSSITKNGDNHENISKKSIASGKDLKALLDQGLISQSDYDAKKAQILQGF